MNSKQESTSLEEVEVRLNLREEEGGRDGEGERESPALAEDGI